MLENVYDIVFIGKDTPESMESYARLLKRFPTAKKSIIKETIYDALAAAFKKSFTPMVWIVWDNLIVNDDFNFDYKVSQYDQKYIHTFLNNGTYDGITLFPKNVSVSNRELEYRFYRIKKEIPVVASRPVPQNFDIVFMSYNELNADENFKNLTIKFPNAVRVHGVKGIHQAHMAAAKLVSTDMFWVVDGDAQIVESFNFDYVVPKHDFDTVHVWRSKNPINDLEYGYGGVKLLPTNLTLKMNINSVDMTTSISSKFKAMGDVSNVTAFNTDAFSAWRSAFRECVKLSSNVIDRHRYQENAERLNAWLTFYPGKPFAQEAVEGAYDGREYGRKNAADPAALSLINDFDWLKKRFEQTPMTSERFQQ